MQRSILNYICEKNWFLWKKYLNLVKKVVSFITGGKLPYYLERKLPSVFKEKWEIMNEYWENSLQLLGKQCYVHCSPASEVSCCSEIDDNSSLWMVVKTSSIFDRVLLDSESSIEVW